MVVFPYRLRYIPGMEQKIPTSSEIRERLAVIGHAETQELSRISGVPFTTLWKIRNGETSNPRIDTACRFFHLIPVKVADSAPHAEAAQAGPARVEQHPDSVSDPLTADPALNVELVRAEQAGLVTLPKQAPLWDGVERRVAKVQRRAVDRNRDIAQTGQAGA